jgi:regulator of sirC expression with transglutaminase-like and TPR domain
MNPTERFARLVGDREPTIPLTEAALLIAAHDHDVDEDAVLADLAALAADAPDDVEAVARYLFAEHGFAGNDQDYADPANSFLDVVLRRRLGIPITLSVLMLDIGQRRGLALHGVGMPAHFLVGSDDGRYVDPFHRGVVLDRAGCRTRFEELMPDTPWRDAYLRPVGPRAILVRMLSNLVHTYVDRSPADAVWALQLRLAVPGVAPTERRDAAALLGSLGRFREAAAALDAVADELDASSAARARDDATRLRARAN